jgi:hypothetical protein
LLILVALSLFCLFKKKNTKLEPYQKWVTHYDNKNAELNETNKQDIHHFYTKSNTGGKSHNPVLTTQSSMRTTIRGPQTNYRDSMDMRPYSSNNINAL